MGDGRKRTWLRRLRYKNNKKCPLRADGPTRRCLVPRRLSFDENVRAKEGGKETLPMVPCGSSPVTRVSRSPLPCEKQSA